MKSTKTDQTIDSGEPLRVLSDLKPQIVQLAMIAALIALFPILAMAAPSLEVLNKLSNDTDSVIIAGDQSEATVLVDSSDYPVVQLAAKFFADDVQRVTGRRPDVKDSPDGASQIILAGTLGRNALIKRLESDGKLKNLDQIRGRWESTLCAVVDKPFPGVDRALVIVGSDRRGTAYGLMRLSEQIGVSPWYWWADVPTAHRDILTVKVSEPQADAPGVKYRGIFINDEDWGMNLWAAKTFDPKFNNIGPKTYEKVFELMLRLRLNYLWPAMHGCSTAFGSVPENFQLADKFGIVAGSSHCEPMLYNNVLWNEKEKGRWNYSLNRDTIHDTWAKTVQTRGDDEAVWTIGIRGIHDRGMETPPNEMPGKIALMTEVFHDQRELLEKDATRQWGPVAQCFVPYKEVLPIYDAGLKVPEDVTLAWVDDNFGYIRRLSSPGERTRSGGSGVYWHVSYYGPPHSYTWINTTAPALMWEELHKAWENNARAIWVVNVGDIKPGEIGMDYFSRLAWNPDGSPLAAQRRFLRDFAAENFGERLAGPVSDLLMDFYRLGTIRKPELMDRAWALSLTPERARELEKEYRKLGDSERQVAQAIPGEARDAYTEMIGFPARVLVESGLIFLADRSAQQGHDVLGAEKDITNLRAELESQVQNYNTNLASGKWNRMMPGLVTGRTLTAWNSQVRWPWGEKQSTNNAATSRLKSDNHKWRIAATADRRTSAGAVSWRDVEGLGPSGNAVALLPVEVTAAWKQNDSSAPALEFDFEHEGGGADAWVEFLPTFRIYPGMKLRIAASVDDGPPLIVEVPGSSGAENENGAVRSAAVQDNHVRARVPLAGLASGKHTLKIRAMDPGLVVDRIALP